MAKRGPWPNHFCFLIILGCHFLGSGSNAEKGSYHSSASNLTRSSFPAGFVFGAGSSSYQIEGAACEDGRAPSIWDIFTHNDPEKIADHSTGDVADEFYYHYKDDISLLKNIGLDAFRFSISWPRILPKGKISGGVNPTGVQFYNSIINETLAIGLKPYVTLFHWDLPQALDHDYGGFLSADIIDDYRDYVDFCFATFGDRVKHWFTLNEPYEFTYYGYGTGGYAPGRCSSYIGNCTSGNSATEPYIVGHHLLLSHAAAVKLYREKYKASQKGQIGVILSCKWSVPFSKNTAGQKAAQRFIDFMLGWFLHPLTYGDYPQIMKSLVGDRLSKFTESESQMLKMSYDYLGINYYTSLYAATSSLSSNNLNLSITTDNRVVSSEEKNGVPIGQPTDVSWLYGCPKGIRSLMLYIKDNYGNPPIFITENGVATANNGNIEQSLEDEQRITYHYEHLTYLLKAIKEGADVKGYFIWSFLDDFEWRLGYTVRFGITYVDYKNRLRRYPKRSAEWFNKFLQGNNASTNWLLGITEREAPSVLQINPRSTDSSVV
ncbi:hypothetical protein RHGRI_019521 [Rhododendron griersonianum]|uniref:Uncharacterized protein n=1 Tax=Rhododendron griersonianum TaxID=479676 RepID=A0AAV6JI92_9ERIC|nr:hypothetical protein RHGRI_019521 [Rhododendron griersonianum]